MYALFMLLYGINLGVGLALKRDSVFFVGAAVITALVLGKFMLDMARGDKTRRGGGNLSHINVRSMGRGRRDD